MSKQFKNLKINNLKFKNIIESQYKTKQERHTNEHKYNDKY
jgi:hypothetical protein